MTGPALEIRDLSLSLNDKPILHNVSFDAQPGEWLSIIGPNGAGKTTLLRSLAGLLHSDQGEIRLEGKVLSAYSSRDRAKRVGYVPQAEGRMLPYTAYEFVLMARFPHIKPLAGISLEDERAARRALQLTHTEAFASRSLDTLSGGERQKVFIAAAIAQGATILLMDEPFTFLDYRHQAEVLDLMRQLNRNEGHTMLCVTHDLNKGVHESDAVLAMRGGRRVFLGAPTDLYTVERLADIYDTPFELVYQDGLAHPFVVPLACEHGGKRT